MGKNRWRKKRLCFKVCATMDTKDPDGDLKG